MKKKDVDIDKKTIAGSTEIDMILSKPSDTILLDLVYLLKIEKVKANDKQVNFQHVKDKIYITSTGPFQAGKQKITMSNAKRDRGSITIEFIETVIGLILSLFVLELAALVVTIFN